MHLVWFQRCVSSLASKKQRYTDQRASVWSDNLNSRVAHGSNKYILIKLYIHISSMNMRGLENLAMIVWGFVNKWAKKNLFYIIFDALPLRYIYIRPLLFHKKKILHKYTTHKCHRLILNFFVVQNSQRQDSPYHNLTKLLSLGNRSKYSHKLEECVNISKLQNQSFFLNNLDGQTLKVRTLGPA